MDFNKEDYRMLILTRREGETIKIGDEIEVRVVDIAGNQVRLGIDAPEVIAVHRQEIYERIKSANTRKS
jgi:carbon storage regulator